jgi:hypothetical protein
LMLDVCVLCLFCPPCDIPLIVLTFLKNSIHFRVNFTGRAIYALQPAWTNLLPRSNRLRHRTRTKMSIGSFNEWSVGSVPIRHRSQTKMSMLQEAHRRWWNVLNRSYRQRQMDIQYRDWFAIEHVQKCKCCRKPKDDEVGWPGILQEKSQRRII